MHVKLQALNLQVEFPHLQTAAIDLKLNKSTHTGPYHTENVCSKPPSYPGSQDTLAEVVEGNTWILPGACGLVPKRQTEGIHLKSTTYSFTYQMYNCLQLSSNITCSYETIAAFLLPPKNAVLHHTPTRPPRNHVVLAEVVTGVRSSSRAAVPSAAPLIPPT